MNTYSRTGSPQLVVTTQYLTRFGSQCQKAEEEEENADVDAELQKEIKAMERRLEAKANLSAFICKERVPAGGREGGRER